MKGPATTRAQGVSENNMVMKMTQPTWLQNSNEEQKNQKHGGLQIIEQDMHLQRVWLSRDQEHILLQKPWVSDQDQPETRRLTSCLPSNESLKTERGPECHSKNLPAVVCVTSYPWSLEGKMLSDTNPGC